MFKKFVTFGVLALFLSISTLALAEEVVTTPRGTKYHKEICRLVKNKDQARKLEKEDALAEDYSPCRRCFKEDIKEKTDESDK